MVWIVSTYDPSGYWVMEAKATTAITKAKGDAAEDIKTLFQKKCC